MEEEMEEVFRKKVEEKHAKIQKGDRCKKKFMHNILDKPDWLGNSSCLGYKDFQ